MAQLEQARLPSGDGKVMKKYEKEIREILEKMDSFVPEAPAPEREREKEPKKKPTNVSVMPVTPPRPIRPKTTTYTRFRQWLRDHKITGSLAYLIFGFFFMICGMIALQNFGSVRIVGEVLVLVGFALYIAPVFIRFFGFGAMLNDEPQFWRGDMVNRDPIFSWKNLKGLFTGKRNRGNNDPWNKGNRR